MSEEKKSLLAITAQANSIAERLIESGGEIDPELESALAVNQKDLAVKVDSYAIIMDRFDFEIDYLKAKAQEFTDAAKVLANAQDRIKSNLKQALSLMGETEIEGESYKFKLSPSKPKLVIEESQLPQEFKMQDIKWVPDKAQIHDALTAGFNVPGAHLEPVNQLRKYVVKASKK